VVSAAEVLMEGVVFGESPRWHDGRVWFSDWGANQVIVLDGDGGHEVVVTIPSFPMCIDFLPDGRLLVVDSARRRLLRREPDGSLVQHADLSAISEKPWNDIVADGRGSAYVNTVGLTAYDIGGDGGLRNRRVWARTPGDHPDGICVDAEGAVWYADVGNKHCVRVREGGAVLATVDLDRGAFACALSRGQDPRLFVVGQNWGGPGSAPASGQVVAFPAPAPGAGRP
jgi:sugar lactone lactonase YvrE